ncbi:MAG: hypothetical protein J6A77_07460 [Lachnospiraceae bacterium]|nr:hypothetical protein [Lachnospiraceae bacterium]
MENIIGLFEAAGVIALLCLGVVGLLYPIMFEISFKEHIGTSGISFWWTVCQMIGVFGTLSYAKDTTSDGFYEALGFTVIVFIIAMIRNYKRIKKLGCDKKVCRAGAMAQMAAPFGIMFIILLIGNLFGRDEKDKD